MGAIERRWIILFRVGQVPEVKRPVNTFQGMREMLEEIYHLDSTIKAFCAEVTWDGQLWIRDGKEELKLWGNDDSKVT